MGNYMNAGSRNEGSMGFEMNYLTKVSISRTSCCSVNLTNRFKTCFISTNAWMGLLANNLVPRAYVPFGQHQDTELWNNQFPETKISGLPVSRRMRGLVYMASRDKIEEDTFHKGIQYALEKLGKSKFGFERTAVIKF